MVEKKRKSFVKRMVTALILGVILGIVISVLKPSMSPATWDVLNKIFFQDITVSEGRSAIGLFYIIQTVFTNALKLAIVPMVFFSIIMSVCSMNDMRKLGRIAGKTIITCSVIIGVSIAAMEDKIKVFKVFCDECSQIVQKFLDFLIIVCSPFSVFCMITRTFAIYGIDQVSNIFSYILVTIIVLIIYLLVAYPIAIGATTRCNPFIFMKKMIKVAIIAFGAAASAPALPLNRETCVKELGCSEEITDFVLPVGMTINMNGTAIMHIIGAAFIATCAGLEVTPMNYLTMTLLAIAASMGTPAIPAAGSVMLYAVLTGAGFNTELCTLIYSLVLAMNKPCEMVLTTLNVVGDAATAVIVSASEKEFNKELYNS